MAACVLRQTDRGDELAKDSKRPPGQHVDRHGGSGAKPWLNGIKSMNPSALPQSLVGWAYTGG